MCELFGLSSEKRIQPGGVLREFLSHASENPHGWGVAGFDGGKASVMKEPESAADSSMAEEFVDAGVNTDLMIAHIRFATKGAVSAENTHPFVLADRSGIEWVLAHNGTIFESDPLSEYVHSQTGETDSERILMYLVDRLNSRMGRDDPNVRPLTKSERISAVEDVIREITPENKVNLMLSDGELLYAHMNYRGSMHVIDRNGTAIISTKPLRAEFMGSQAGSWEELPLNTLMVYEKGQLLYRGAAHDNEYFEDEEKTKLLYMDYAYM